MQFPFLPVRLARHRCLVIVLRLASFSSNTPDLTLAWTSIYGSKHGLSETLRLTLGAADHHQIHHNWHSDKERDSKREHRYCRHHRYCFALTLGWDDEFVGNELCFVSVQITPSDRVIKAVIAEVRGAYKSVVGWSMNLTSILGRQLWGTKQFHTKLIAMTPPLEVGERVTPAFWKI